MGGRRNSYGYSQYHGRGANRSRTVLLFIIALLAILLAAGVAFYALVDLEYTENGVLVHWPWAQESASLPPISSDPIALDTDPPVVTLEPTPSPEPTPTPPPAYEPIGAVTVTAAQLKSGSAAQAVADAGGTALVVEMKDMNGKLAWQSQVPLAANLGTNAADNAAAQAVRTLAEAGNLYLVARVQCFRDPILARNRIGSLMTRGGNVWHDYQGLGWTSPASQQVSDYLSTLCLELSMLLHAGVGTGDALSLLAEESVDKMRALLPDLEPGAFAENINTRGLELKSLPIGTRLRLGETVVEVTQIGKECHGECAIRKAAGTCVMPTEGIFAAVLQEGTVRAGDPVEIIEEAAE